MNSPETSLAPTDAPPCVPPAWSQPLCQDRPCGEDLEYDPRFVSLMAMARGRDEQQLGSSILPAQEPDWAHVSRVAEQLMKETRDLRLVAIWSHASLRLAGLEGLADGIAVVAHLLATQWERVHPQIEPDGDAFMRASAVAALADSGSLLRTLRAATFVNCSGDEISVRDAILLLEGEPAPECPLSTVSQLAAAVAGEGGRNLRRFDAIGRIAADLAAIRSSFARHLAPPACPDLSRLETIVSKLAASLSHRSPDGTVVTPVADDAPVSGPVANDEPKGGHQTADPRIRTRRDALDALVAVREYFERNEPSHPAVLLIRRVERLSDSTFLDIIADLVPDRLDQIRSLAGLPSPS